MPNFIWRDWRVRPATVRHRERSRPLAGSRAPRVIRVAGKGAWAWPQPSGTGGQQPAPADADQMSEATPAPRMRSRSKPTDVGDDATTPAPARTRKSCSWFDPPQIKLLRDRRELTASRHSSSGERSQSDQAWVNRVPLRCRTLRSRGSAAELGIRPRVVDRDELHCGLSRQHRAAL
jgi:hypothetical protein